MLPKILLHICCAPDSTAVFERLASDYEVTGFFQNPNVHPAEEYQRRLVAAQQAAAAMGFGLDVPDYHPQSWLEHVKGLETEPEKGKRCQACFLYNLSATARHAHQRGMAMFATTLTVSPHKRFEDVAAAGEAAAARFGVKFLALNFKKQGGFLRSLELSNGMGLYRQKYCGCKYSFRPR